MENNVKLTQNEVQELLDILLGIDELFYRYTLPELINNIVQALKVHYKNQVSRTESTDETMQSLSFFAEMSTYLLGHQVKIRKYSEKFLDEVIYE